MYVLICFDIKYIVCVYNSYKVCDLIYVYMEMIITMRLIGTATKESNLALAKLKCI